MVTCLFLESKGALRMIPPALFHDNSITGFAGVVLSLVRESTLTPDHLENPVHPPHPTAFLIPPFLPRSWPLHCSKGGSCFVLVASGRG
jgi:hypothetical protein